MMPITLQDWRAWQPDHPAGGDPRLSTNPRPKGDSVPAMLRRRLNVVGRAVCDMLAELDPEGRSILLHASRHGDAERTLEMLYALADGDDLSPARFGMSVHNAILGVHSIANGNRRSLQALAATGDEVAALFSEARGYLADGESDIVAVFSDVAVPSRFAEYLDDPVETAAVALRLSTTGGTPIVASRFDVPDGVRSPQPGDMIAWLLTGGPLLCPARRIAWELAPCPSSAGHDACMHNGLR
ncbi:beta-ketoacyl synthase chain length factor [Aidingimonas lacisalsi]|uniref:beta-ketoacyl synthase chain length factor n=1 Tax=Aidingimonas lacisalsi TaxID=2604086 RepID=UPI0011D22B40|nr:beta-ketoacyl synthase chain length factor [Aidingimonas lacisalsi]